MAFCAPLYRKISTDKNYRNFDIIMGPLYCFKYFNLLFFLFLTFSTKNIEDISPTTAYTLSGYTYVLTYHENIYFWFTKKKKKKFN